MCVDCFVNIGDPDPEITTPQFDGEEQLIEEVYTDETNPFNLPDELYLFYFFALIEQLQRAYGLPSDFDVAPGTPIPDLPTVPTPPGVPSILPDAPIVTPDINAAQRRRLAVIAKENISLFSGAKTFQNVLELSLNVFDDNGQLRPFNEFREIALNINSRYNVAWLQAEQSAAFRQSQAIENWQQIEENIDTFPLLKYVTVGDERVRPTHRPLDGIVKPVNDPFWDAWFPPNGWRCRCIVQQLESGRVSTIDTPVNDDDNFNTNVGKTGLVFSPNHPYNQVPPEFQRAKNGNFGFTVPTDTEIRQFLDS